MIIHSTRRPKLVLFVLLLFQSGYSFLFFKSNNNTNVKSISSINCQTNKRNNNDNCNAQTLVSSSSSSSILKSSHNTASNSKKPSAPSHKPTSSYPAKSSTGPIHRAISHFFYKKKSPSDKSKGNGSSAHSFSTIYTFLMEVWEKGPVIVLAREAVKQLEQEWHWKWFIKFMFETRLDEDALVDIISATCNLAYCLTIIIAFFFLPRNMVALLGVITAPVGPLVAFLVLATAMVVLTLLCTYPGWCIVFICVYMFLVGKLGQAIMIRLGLDIDGDGDVDFLDILKLLANAVGGNKSLIGWVLIHIHHFLNDTLKDELRDIKLDLLALKMKFNIATVEEVQKYNSLIEKPQQALSATTKRVTSVPKLPLPSSTTATTTIGHEYEHINEHIKHLSNGSTVIYEHNGQHYTITPYDLDLHQHHQHQYYQNHSQLPQQQHQQHDIVNSGAVTPMKKESGSSPSKAMSQVKNLLTLLSDSQQTSSRLSDSGHTRPILQILEQQTPITTQTKPI